MQIKFKETPEWKKAEKKFNAVQPRLAKGFNKALAKSAFVIEGTSKRRTPVDTGRLRSSIYTTVNSRMATVQPKTNYAAVVHKKQPFMTEGLKDAIPILRKLFNEAISKALK